MARRRLDQPPQSLQRLLLALLRRKIEPRIASIDAGQGEQLGNKRRVIGRRRSVRKHGLKLVELRRGVIVPFEPRGALELADDRMERAVGVMGRAEVAQAEVLLAGNSLEQRRAQARLSDAGLAREQDDATLAALRLFPTSQQQLQLFVAAQQRRHAGLVQGLEAAFRGAEAHDLPRRHGLGEALERHRAEVAVIEEPAGEAVRGRLDHHRVRFGERFQAGSEIGRPTDNAVLLRLVLASEVAHDDQPGGDADADLRCDLRGPVALV